MRIRLFGAVAALLGAAAVATAQTAPPMPAVPPVPAAPMNPPGLTPAPPVLPPASLPAPPAAPPIMAANPNCGTPVAAPCNDPCKSKKGGLLGGGLLGGGLLGKAFIGSGTASPVGCSCFAAERTFMFGSCRQFHTPGKTCNGSGIEYGPGGLYNQDNCRHVTSFLNR